MIVYGVLKLIRLGVLPGEVFRAGTARLGHGERATRLRTKWSSSSSAGTSPLDEAACLPGASARRVHLGRGLL